MGIRIFETPFPLKNCSFNNRFPDSPLKAFLSGSEAHFHVIRRYAIAFIEKHVAGRKDVDLVLHRGDPMVTRYIREP